MMLSRIGTVGLVGICALLCSSCRSTSTTRTTSAQKYAAGSPDLRTVDNTGYVDPGGRTRQVSAGVGGAADPRNGVAPPHSEEPTGGAKSDRAAETAPPGPPATSSSTDPAELTERAARALCDRETYCGRIGPGKAFGSGDACMAGKRERVRRAIDESVCHAIRGDRVAPCLNAIRGADCGAPEAPLQPPPACRADALCGL